MSMSDDEYVREFFRGYDEPDNPEQPGSSVSATATTATATTTATAATTTATAASTAATTTTTATTTTPQGSPRVVSQSTPLQSRTGSASRRAAESAKKSRSKPLRTELKKKAAEDQPVIIDLTMDEINQKIKEADDNEHDSYVRKVSQDGPIAMITRMLEARKRTGVKKGQPLYQRRHIATGEWHPCKREQCFKKGEKRKKKGEVVEEVVEEGPPKYELFNMTCKSYDQYLAVWTALWKPESDKHHELKRKLIDADPPELMNHTQCRNFLNKKQQAAAANTGGGGGVVEEKPMKPSEMEARILELEEQVDELVERKNYYKDLCQVHQEHIEGVEFSSDSESDNQPANTA